jgi:hypothetical protein
LVSRCKSLCYLFGQISLKLLPDESAINDEVARKHSDATADLTYRLA